MLSAIALAIVGQAAPFKADGPRLVITMESGGKIVIATDTKNAPKTTARIVELTEQKFFDKQRFHRIENWVVQWGAPASKEGDLNRPEVGGGGSGKTIPFESSPNAFVRGVVGIASTGMKVGGDSQIFILKSDAKHLNGNYAILGYVVSGMEVVDKLERGARIASIRVQEVPPAPAPPARPRPRRT